MTQLSTRADVWQPGQHVNVRHVMRVMRDEYRSGEILVVAAWIDGLPAEEQPRAREIYRRLQNYLFAILGYTGTICDLDPVLAPLMQVPGNLSVIRALTRVRYPTASALILARYQKMPAPEFIDLILRSQFSHPLDVLKAAMISYGLIAPSQIPAAHEPVPYETENIP